MMPDTKDMPLLDHEKSLEAIELIQTVLTKCEHKKIGAWDVFYAINIVGMMLVETGLVQGWKSSDFAAVKKVAQTIYMEDYTKNPELWRPKPGAN